MFEYSTNCFENNIRYYNLCTYRPIYRLDVRLICLASEVPIIYPNGRCDDTRREA